MKTEKRECPHCHGSLERYEDPKAVEIIAKLTHPPLPMVMGQRITRDEIIEGLRSCLADMVRLERKSDPTLRGYPDAEAILDYIEEHGLPPKDMAEPSNDQAHPQPVAAVVERNQKNQ